MEKLTDVLLFLSWGWGILWPTAAILVGIAEFYSREHFFTRLLRPTELKMTIFGQILWNKYTLFWIVALCLIYIL